MNQIFKAEMNDGIGDLVANSSTLAFCSRIISATEPTEEDYKAVASFDSETLHTKDLFRLDAILASVGWNKNDDIFDRYETWNARATPEDKQFNFMHDERDIIGHITKSYILNPLGEKIDTSASIDELPEFFDIAMGSVLYKTWSDETLKNRMDSIITSILEDSLNDRESEKDSWYVSMECLFPAFDYELVDNRGNAKIVKRAESSAFLTKHLRAYGGSGQYNGYKIGRLLRDFSFSGVGLVNNPANPRSVILKRTTAVYFKGNNMPENLDLDALQTELAEAKKNYEDMKKKMDEAKSQFEASASSLAAQVQELQAALAAEKSEKEKMAEEMKQMKKEKTFMKRKAQLSEAGFSGEEIEDTLNKFESLDDSVFDAVVATLKAKAEEFKAKAAECKDEEEDVKAKKTKADEEVDRNEATAEVLETAEEVKDVSMADNFEEEDVKTFASEWFTNNVLKTTASIKK